MNKARLVSELSTQLSLTKNDTEERLAHLIDLMCEELDQQNTIHIPGLGQFETRERASYVAFVTLQEKCIYHQKWSYNYSHQSC